MVACVEEVCKIWIWLFRNVRGEGFEGSSVARMSRGKILPSLAFLPPGSGKGTPESGDGQPEQPRPDVPPGSSAEKRYADNLTNQRGES